MGWGDPQRREQPQHRQLQLRAAQQPAAATTDEMWHVACTNNITSGNSQFYRQSARKTTSTTTLVIETSPTPPKQLLGNKRQQYDSRPETNTYTLKRIIPHLVVGLERAAAKDERLVPGLAAVALPTVLIAVVLAAAVPLATFAGHVVCAGLVHKIDAYCCTG